MRTSSKNVTENGSLRARAHRSRTLDLSWPYIKSLRRYREAEQGLSHQNAPFSIALCYPNTYRVGAASLGLQWSYVVPEPPGDEHTPQRYAEHYAAIAEHGKSHGIKVCIEHFPGTAFPTVSSTLDFIASTGHDNLYLLFDIGHAQMANEDPRAELTAAGDRLGYVHLDDNDGVGDLHLGLTDGIQTEDSLASLFQVLSDVGYEGPVSLEMKDDLPDPLDAINRSQQLVRRISEIL